MQTKQSNDLPNRQLVNIVTDHLSKMSHDPTIGKELYKFIDKYKIGQNDYGALMDALPKETSDGSSIVWTSLDL